jgi:hypothetical protein
VRIDSEGDREILIHKLYGVNRGMVWVT